MRKASLILSPQRGWAGWLALLLWFGTPSAWAQEPQLRELNQVLQQAVTQSAVLDADRRVLGARFELMNAQVDGLLGGRGDWEAFFQFYLVTQQQASRLGPLPASMQPSWSRIQTLMAEVGRQRGRPLPPVAGPTELETPGNLSEATLRRALLAVQAIEGSLSGPPPGCDMQRYQKALSHLQSLRTHLQSSLAGGPPGGETLAQLVRDRRLVQLTRSALQLPAKRFWELDQALDQLPP